MLGEARSASAPSGVAAADGDLSAAVRAYIARLALAHPAALDDGTLYDRVIAEVERPLIEAMLGRHGGNQLRAARAMGINRNTLRKRLDSLNIPVSGDDEGGEALA